CPQVRESRHLHGPGRDRRGCEKGRVLRQPPQRARAAVLVEDFVALTFPVIPGRLEEANPESRDSGFDAAHRPGMTGRERGFLAPAKLPIRSATPPRTTSRRICFGTDRLRQRLVRAPVRGQGLDLRPWLPV